MHRCGRRAWQRDDLGNHAAGADTAAAPPAMASSSRRAGHRFVHELCLGFLRGSAVYEALLVGEK